MSISSVSVKPTFKNNDFINDQNYQPLFDGKFVENIYQLILNGNTKEVKKMITSILSDRANNDEHDRGIVLGDENLDDDDYMPSSDSDEFDYYNKIANLILPNGFKLLILAAQVANSALVKFFIELEFDVNCKDSQLGLTPLLAACCSRRRSMNTEGHDNNVKECLRLLVEAGANVDSQLMQNEERGIHLVAAEGHLGACEFLIPLVRDINCTNYRGSTPLMLAAHRGHVAIVRTLLRAGADRSLRNRSGVCAAELAVMSGNDDVVRELVGEDVRGLQFYRAWGLAHRELVAETDTNEHSITLPLLRSFASRYQDDPVGYMCTNLGLSHLQPLLHKLGISFADLRNIGDSQLKQMGVNRFCDRKNLLNLMQEVHKQPWNHDGSIYSPDYKKPVKPQDVVDVVESVSAHLELLESSVQYLCLHLSTNKSHYKVQPRMTSILDKMAAHCHTEAFDVAAIASVAAKMDAVFQQMCSQALDEDLSSRLDDDAEALKQRDNAHRFPRLVKTGVLLSALSLTAIVLWRRVST